MHRGNHAPSVPHLQQAPLTFCHTRSNEPSKKGKRSKKILAGWWPLNALAFFAVLSDGDRPSSLLSSHPSRFAPLHVFLRRFASVSPVYHPLHYYCTYYHYQSIVFLFTSVIPCAYFTFSICLSHLAARFNAFVLLRLSHPPFILSEREEFELFFLHALAPHILFLVLRCFRLQTSDDFSLTYPLLYYSTPHTFSSMP